MTIREIIKAYCELKLTNNIQDDVLDFLKIRQLN